MPDDFRAAMKAAYANLEADERRREDMVRRALNDPVAAAILHVIRRVVDDAQGPDQQVSNAILDALAAILDLVQEAAK